MTIFLIMATGYSNNTKYTIVRQRRASCFVSVHYSFFWCRWIGGGRYNAILCKALNEEVVCGMENARPSLSCKTFLLALT